MDLGPVDARLLPVLPLRESWIVLAEAPPERVSGTPVLLAEDGPDAPVLAGIAVDGGPWVGASVATATGSGSRCGGTIDRVAEAAWVQWSSPPWLDSCPAPASCPGTAAAAAWSVPGGHLIVAHLVHNRRCAAPLGWARAAGFGEFSPRPALPSDSDAVTNLALASFRRLPDWARIQSRFLREAQPLDAPEWDTSGGNHPEVARFDLPGDPVITVAAQTGGCPAGFTAELSAAFRKRVVDGVIELVPWSDASPTMPGFAPQMLDLLGDGLRFADRLRSGGPGFVGVDARPLRPGGCG
ncbi:MAG: hypothetical protein EXR71_03465 [Myxococcales bacterium]|nr:hypothetical protein [Myxococcales bacterium]